MNCSEFQIAGICCGVMVNAAYYMAAEDKLLLKIFMLKNKTSEIRSDAM